MSDHSHSSIHFVRLSSAGKLNFRYVKLVTVSCALWLITKSTSPWDRYDFWKDKTNHTQITSEEICSAKRSGEMWGWRDNGWLDCIFLMKYLHFQPFSGDKNSLALTHACSHPKWSHSGADGNENKKYNSGSIKKYFKMLKFIRSWTSW